MMFALYHCRLYCATRSGGGCTLRCIVCLLSTDALPTNAAIGDCERTVSPYVHACTFPLRNPRQRDPSRISVLSLLLFFGQQLPPPFLFPPLVVIVRTRGVQVIHSSCTVAANGTTSSPRQYLGYLLFARCRVGKVPSFFEYKENELGARKGESSVSSEKHATARPA